MTSANLTRFALAVVVALMLVACDGEEGTDLSTTSSLISSPTSVAEQPTTTTVVPGGDSTSTSLVGEQVANHEVVARQSDPEGETLYIVIPPGAYTDVDIENFLIGLVDDGTVTYAAEIFDDAAAVEAFRKLEAERTEPETQLIDDHHFASISNGVSVEFHGPFASSPGFIIGS